MGEAIERLSTKLDAGAVGLARIFIPPYPRVVNGKVQNVDGYWREVGSLDELGPEERMAYESAPLPPLPPPPSSKPTSWLDRFMSPYKADQNPVPPMPGDKASSGPTIKVKTLPRMTAPYARKRVIEDMASDGYVPSNVVRTTTGKTIITFVKQK